MRRLLATPCIVAAAFACIAASEAVALAARHDKQTHGLVNTESVSCLDGHSSPANH